MDISNIDKSVLEKLVREILEEKLSSSRMELTLSEIKIKVE